MISLAEMNTDKKFRLRGMSLVEVIVATAVSAFVLTGLFSSLGSIYFTQKKITATQRFASESRFIMERVVQLTRNNTLDYDRFFEKKGPDVTGCSSFNENQVPEGTLLSEMMNVEENRKALTYAAIFNWDVVSGSSSRRVRNLGGKKPVASGGEDIVDPCTEAWGKSMGLTELYLINRSRTQRVAVSVSVDGRIQMQRMLGTDTTGDQKVDTWSLYSKWEGGQCDLYQEAVRTTNLGPADGIGNEQDCMEVYDWTVMSPKAISVEAFEFIPTPNRDPYLNYRVDSAQVHPQVFFRLKTKIRNPQDYGLSYDGGAEMTLQTTATSRVFGNPRK